MRTYLVGSGDDFEVMPGALSRVGGPDERFGLSLKPAKGLDVRGKLRYYETNNAMQYQSCNPLTGQWGRILNDGSGLSLVTANTTAGANPAGTSANAYNATHCDLAALLALNLVPSAGNMLRLRSGPDYKQLNANVTADYQVSRSSSVNAAIERRPSGASSGSATRPGKTRSSWATSTAAPSTA
jgi:hypothetical protein